MTVYQGIMSGDASIDSALESVKRLLIAKNALFNIFFCESPEPNIDDELMAKAQELYEEVYADLQKPYSDFKEFYEAWKNHHVTTVTVESSGLSQTCNRLIFHPQTSQYRKLYTPPKKRLKTEFNPYDFLMKKINDNDCYAIKFSVDTDNCLTEYSFDERNKNNLIADQSLRKMANAISVLNASCNYRILDIHSEQGIR